MSNLEKNVMKEFHNLTKKIKSLEDEGYYKQLKGILHQEISDYFHKNKDGETHELKWKDDDQIKAFTDTLWDKSADHIAENYLKMTSDDIKSLKKPDPDDPNKTQWETFIAQYMGVDKEGLFESLKEQETLNVENLLEYIKPLYETHLNIRQGKHVTKKIKTNEDKDNVLKYLSTVKKHNPKSLKGIRFPKTFKSIEDAQKKYLGILKAIPSAYSPNKPDTYEQKK